MKENDDESEKLIDTSRENIMIEKEQNGNIENTKQDNIKENRENSVTRLTSFEVELLNAVKKEEEELYMKKKLSEKNKIKKKLTLTNTKDYLFVFILLMSSVFNFNYFYLVNIIIATIYIFYIEQLSSQAKKIKYLCEIFSVGYSSYLLIFKLISLILVNNNNKTMTVKHNMLFKRNR